ncbi:response regulator [Pelomicrobium methylotrophicum]|uniref:Response regulator transcription factor n=1 Tax=Pelomicrobium methylotrophicum TaxID=2602750 RepID=A0A5C7EIK3_9PROT|nr:response regulator transcription factor [Pelomicrobium methylotrophicum]TXF11855.1 response regulator transcription factor [Pelomicrobium methylotrophicum]
MRLLLVEDDPHLGDALAAGLRQAGHAVDWVKDGVAADLALTAEPFDLLILDLGLPRRAGLAVLRTLRARGQSLPVIILTARDAVEDKVAGLDAGADDYLIKPVDLAELAARVRALARRAAGLAQPRLKVGHLVIDPAARCAALNGAPLALSAKEFALLMTLAENAGRVVPRARLEAALYGWDETPESNALEVHIHHLRRKLGPERIQTLRGIGYRLVPA